MNPDLIYHHYRDEALARQFTADAYETFVATPLRERYSYRPDDVYENVILRAVKTANKKASAARTFADPVRIDNESATAAVITEDIILRILEAHFVIADLTFENPGVLLETGMAFGLKPTKQIILLTQGDLDTLHLDIRNNRVINYNDRETTVDAIAGALIAAAEAFEADGKRYVEMIKTRLTPDAIRCLHGYGKKIQEDPAYTLDDADACAYFQDRYGELRFRDAMKELLASRLLATGDMTGGTHAKPTLRATALGRLVIEGLWPDLRARTDTHTPRISGRRR